MLMRIGQPQRGLPATLVVRLERAHARQNAIVNACVLLNCSALFWSPSTTIGKPLGPFDMLTCNNAFI